ncbi:Panacea domain-containing protein ['Cynodon dactylon' phytoplasma]|uniref:Panacea domain-containing protein n=1 Tax='Cynodon dactylon' phytoplasma TaxID=295320 RepID=UPI001265B994|nr:type II toxin-antitoxin system antitoxin SocA domain-containing protein ['Cynodon dactylon' phytoplasma]KAB8121694.1 DUF4065 domain-containing protein ['Cynodon dactylon' phytoplasma]
MTQNKINIFDVANYLIEKIPSITNMKLQKLIYYAHAYHLVKQKEKLVDNTLQAWIYGPVFPELYQTFCKYSYLPLKSTEKGDFHQLTEIQKASLDQIIQRYGHLDSGDLSEQTHNEDPWLDAYNMSHDWEQNVITDQALVKFFRKVFR